MRSHELAKALLAAPDGHVECSVDISTCEQDANLRCFGDLVGINGLPDDIGFGSDIAMLLFEGSVCDA